MADRFAAGGRLFGVGNGGSSTDAAAVAERRVQRLAASAGRAHAQSTSASRIRRSCPPHASTRTLPHAHTVRYSSASKSTAHVRQCALAGEDTISTWAPSSGVPRLASEKRNSSASGTTPDNRTTARPPHAPAAPYCPAASRSPSRRCSRELPARARRPQRLSIVLSGLSGFWAAGPRGRRRAGRCRAVPPRRVPPRANRHRILVDHERHRDAAATSLRMVATRPGSRRAAPAWSKLRPAAPRKAGATARCRTPHPRRCRARPGPA
jgi:hypothetical protein